MITVPTEQVPLGVGCTALPPLTRGAGDLAALVPLITPAAALQALWLQRVLHATLPGGGHAFVQHWSVYSLRPGVPTGMSLHRTVDAPAAPTLFICMSASGTLTRPAS